MRVLIIATGLFLTSMLFSVQSTGQNFIAMDKTQIMQVMKDSYKKYKLNTSITNPHYNYLKYENKIEEITILFFLDDNDKCTLVRKMCDYSNINEVISELDQLYKKAGKNSWTYTEKGKVYAVDLAEEEWYFTVTTKLKAN